MSHARANRVVVLFGGGIESCLLVRRYLSEGRTVIPLHIRCGLIWDESESRFVRRFCETFHCETLRPLVEFSISLTEWLEGH